MLGEREASPVQLAQKLDATLGTVAYHVRTLHDLGLIELTATRQRRGATEHVYQALETPRFSDDAWEGLAPVAKQRMLTAMLRQIGEYVNGSAAVGGFDRADANASRLALRLDERGWKQMARATKKWLAEVDRIQAQADERHPRDGAADDGDPRGGAGDDGASGGAAGDDGDPRDSAGDDVFEVGLVLLLFEGVALSDQTLVRDGDDGNDRNRSRDAGTPVS